MLLSTLHLDQVRMEYFSVQTSALSLQLFPYCLLIVLLPFQAPANDSVLQEFADVLSSQLGILEWCKNNNT